MNEKYMKKLVREMEIDNYLEDIKEVSNVAYGYITNKIEVNDLEELIVKLDCVDYYIKNVKDLIEEMALEYEQEIKELENE